MISGAGVLVRCRSPFGFALLAGACAAALAGDFDCVIEPRQVLELRSPIEGLIERINVDRGDFIRRGQVLAVLDSAVDRAQAEIARHRAKMEGAVRSGESRVEFTTGKSRRMEDLHSQNYISAQGRDEAVTERRLAEAELRDSPFEVGAKHAFAEDRDARLGIVS